MTNDITAKTDLQPISVQEMIDLAPGLFTASVRFLILESYLPVAA